jgi:hypothetical protein
MSKQRRKFLITAILFLSLGYVFSGGDCGTDNDDPPPATSVAAPTSVDVSVSQASGHFATVTWNHSSDNNRSDFTGYRVVTYEVDSAGTIISTFRTDNVPRTSNSQVINSIVPLKRFKTYVTAELSNNVKSDSVATKIYAAVFENNGSIDEFMETGTAQSGFGWDVDFGVGTKYSFTAGSAINIDMHARNTGNGLRFYSPSDYLPGVRSTSYELVGQGQAAFDETDLVEPTSSSIAVIADNVYLLKLQSNHYVKVWVKEIASTGGFQTINFTYKVQPIEGLRVVKR